MEIPIKPQAYQLLHEGVLALADVEAAGIRIDVGYLKTTLAEIEGQLAALRAQLQGGKVWQVWRKVFGDKANLGSRVQLATVFYDHLGHPCTVRTPTGRPSTDDTVIGQIAHPFIKNYFKLEKLRKLHGTYLKGVLREVTADGYLHPFFHLHTVDTYRSSSSEINFQNIPIRDPQVGKWVRRAFVPRPGCSLVETDYGAMEFKIAACVWEDPKMIAYASDPAQDVHYDFTGHVFKLPRSEISKAMRTEGKNKFVFPILYGSYWLSCAEGLWGVCDTMKTTSGQTAREVLAAQGIIRLRPADVGEGYRDPTPGTFEARVKEAEAIFMKTCPVFAEGKDRVYRDYRSRGWFELVTGFVCRGLYTRNKVLNYRVQGPAFHCLLWSLIRVVRKELRRRKMRAKVIGQIHDCILGDVPDRELQDYLNIINTAMTQLIRKHWPWIVCPLVVEADVTSTNWHEKEPWVEDAGVWTPKTKKSA